MFGTREFSRWCFVDVETTGTRLAHDRLTEIGIVSVDCDGDQGRVSEWSSLVNPGVPVPAAIQSLTGITDAMVRAAPRFADLAEALYDRLDGALFVAHNARFDYGFLQAEFARAGLPWKAVTLCTVRLSRLLYPDRTPHTLDAIVARFGLDGEQRHRALGDARVLWRLLRQLYERRARHEVDAAIARLLARPSTPPALPPHVLDEIPRAPGVYLFYGANAHPIYIGKSVDLRTRVAQHFASDRAGGADLRLVQEVQRVEWEETAGEIGALLREAELIKARQPAHNVRLRRQAKQVLVALDDAGRPRFVAVGDVALERLGQHYGPFASRAHARRLLTDLAARDGLCLTTMALAARARRCAPEAPCFNYQLKRCRGACVGAETPQAHGARAAQSLAQQRVPAWPHAGAVAIIETNADRFREDIHVFDRWCWLGSVRSLAAAESLARSAPRVFEADAYRIAREALARAADGRLERQPID